MSENRFTGAARDAAGKVQEAVGDFAGDARTQVRGKVNQARGQAEDVMGDAADMIRDQPLVAALVLIGVGYLIGRLRLL
ncbi:MULTISPECIES: CsbD family protein [unclassified Acidisoma]|jgi:uncharacterized protein YjbJ (UPF0337 family)|uniref:CsbD family protein n=1 Tax=unclassified Acidisoma TaxID=2634065 RepID=UPI00131C07E3|nr:MULTISPECIES: CsbD family protein [unclassified Acidisoma]